MDRVALWTNFKLGEELQISGRFIFNGLRCFHEMESLNCYDEIFETLYNLSVGIERLLKVAIILVEHDATVDQEKFELSLMTHDHQSLALRLRKAKKLSTSKVLNDFLALLGRFYKTHRYDRYVLSSMTGERKEQKEFHAFLTKHLSIRAPTESDIFATENEDRFRKFLGRVVGKIVVPLYELIIDEAHLKRIYTYEVRHDSKAGKIFLGRQFDFLSEEVLWKELIIYLVNTRDHSGMLNFIRKIVPLDFDPGLIDDYLDCFKSVERMIRCSGEIETHYDEFLAGKRRERLRDLEIISNRNVSFADDQEEDE